MTDRRAGRMHAASMRSPRLLRVLAALAGGRELSTMDIVQEARVCAVNSIVSELRTHGYVISCRQEDHVFFYQWLPDAGE